MRKKLTMLLASLFLVLGTAWAQAPVATPEAAITGLLNRIGGNGAAEKFEIVIDANLAANGKDVFVITSQNGKPCIKGNTQLSVATGINWYLNHYAHINLTWNNLTTDLSKASLPVPTSEEKHVCNTTYRYDFNTCTFSYSMAFWTWERWQQEIDWMALHGINAPLNLVGLDVVTRKFLRELGVSENDINAYIAGPGFIAWFAMNNLEGWGGTINSSSTGVNMSGNPDWWYTRQEQLCRNMLQRMRELGMQPVIPGFSGQVPNCIVNYSINGFNSGDVVNNGTWAGGYTRPDILKPNTTSYQTFATVYYKHLHEVMGVSELYSIDPFHEGSLPGGVTNATCYPNIMAELDKHFGNVEQSVKNTYKVTKSPSWIIQYWQGVPQSGAFTAMKDAGYTNRFIGLDLFADNIYADNAAKWRTNYYDTCPYIYCMLHNFGGRSGLHGRLETTMDGYFQALAKGNNCQGIGATPEGTETNPVLYDMLFELPWMNVNNRPTADKWLEDYAYSRYGVQNEKALEALQDLKKSVWDCKVNQQGTSEAVILARPNWTINSVSSWSTSAIYWDTQDVLQAADKLYSIKEAVTANGGQDGIANYNYDFIDVVRQAMVDYAAQLLPLINAAHNSGDNAEYTRLYQLYLQLMLDLDEMLSYDENFKLERWTSLARNIADEVAGTTENDRNWLEWNARTQVTVWSSGNTDLHDYSNRCWAGLIKDFHYKRWKQFFENNGNAFSGGWYSGFEYPWTVDFNETYNLAGDYSQVVIPNDMTATEKAAQTFGEYFGRIKGATKNYIFPMGVATKATKSDVIPEVYRGQTVDLPLVIGKNVTITSIWVDLNNDGAKGNGETLTATNNKIAIPAEAKIGKTTAQVVYSDGTDITFNLALVEDITANRTVIAVAGANGSVAIEGTNELSITNAEAVKMTATAKTGYNFKDWTDANSNVVSNDNPFIYYGKEAATFTANFIQDKWGVPTEDKGDWGDATVKTSFVNELTFAYYNREPETIYEATVAPDNLFNTIPQIINVPQGASFDVTWSDDNNNGLKFCCLSAYIDLNADGDFTDEGELLKVAGTKGAQSTTACEGKINVILPYDAPLGLTHMRIRFDGAWKDAGYDATTKSYDAKAQLNRMCYELVINVTDGSSKAAHVVVESNNDAWGTAEVWTDETPGWTASNEWDVSASIPVHIKATKASEDVEFLGWYDHYGRLLTTELEYAMLAREDATYTARFRKALDIDGWQFEYRTEPGSEVRVKGSRAIVGTPEDGKTYYIYAPTNYNSVSATRYLYDNDGTLATNTTAAGVNYVWTCIVNNDNTYSFQNASGKYLANDGNYYISIGATAAKYKIEDPSREGVSLVNSADYSGGKYMVTKHDGSAFNRNGSKTNGEWCSDYVFVEVSIPDVVVLTNVRQSGDHDLVIPETVEILGEQCKIVGFDNNLFTNNKDLWSISLPSTIEYLSEKSLLNGTMTGKVASGAGTTNAANYTVYNLEETIKVADGFKVTVSGTSDGSTFNEWGSGLFATGTDPLAAKFDDGFQFYLAKAGNFVLKVDNGDKEYALDNANCKVSAGTPFTATIEYKNNTITITVDNGAGQTGVYTRGNVTLANISAFSAAIPTGITLNVNVETYNESDPFEGCTNLFDITVADGSSYYVVDNKLYNTGDYALHTLADEKKEDELRALGGLIDNTEALMDVIATSIDPTGKATEIALSTTQGDNYYIWCNNPHTGDNDDARGGVAALLDENDDSYLHTNYSNVSATNDFLQVELGSGNELYQFKIAGKQRKGASDDIPKIIEILGSTDKNSWENIATVNGLPQNGGASWESKAMTTAKKYPYLKFVVTTGTNRKFFHMAKFDLFKLTSTVEVESEYKDLAGITNDEAANVYDNLVNALYVYNNGGTAEEFQAAYDALKPLYDAVNDKKNALQYVRELSELIDLTDKLIDVITVPSSTGNAVALALNTTEGNAFYVSTNADQNTGGGNKDGDGIAGLIDNDLNRYFHSRWGGAAVNAPHHIKVDLGEGNEMKVFQFSYVAHNAPDPTTIDIKGSNDGTDFVLIETITKDVTAVGVIYTSKVFEASEAYRYLLFEVTNSQRSGFNSSFGNYKCFGMKEFDLFRLIEVSPGYKSLGGITNEEATAAYDLMLQAQSLCNIGGTAAELKTALDNLQAAYDNLNAQQAKVLNGVYHINYNGAPAFIAYSPALTNLTGATEGYRMFDATTDNVDAHHQEAHNEAIANKVAADELFTIVPNSLGTGYTFSAQGLYMRTTSVSSQWCVQSFSTADADAGVYLVDETNVAGIYKLKSDKGGTQYVNDWGPVFGNDNHSDAISTFSFTPVTEYTITIPERGDTTFCLPFNVILPEGVEAYDINDLSREVLITAENLLVKVAGVGDILQAGTPVVVKAAPGDYTLEITMNSDGAKTSLAGSVLRGNFVKQTLDYDDSNKKFILNGKVWEVIDRSQEIPANTCWVEAKADVIEDDYIDMDPDFVEIGDWKFRYEHATNGIKLTHGAVSGSGALDIPNTITIDGKEQKVVAISKDFMHGNTELTSVTFPASLVNLGFRELVPMFEGEYAGQPGDGATYNGNQLVGEATGLNRCYVFPKDPATGKPYLIGTETAWKLTLDVTVDTEKQTSYNNWGSAIVSTKENSLDDYYHGYMQIYMQASRQNIVVKLDNADDRYKYSTPVLDANGSDTGELLVMNSFKFELEHDGTGGYQVVIYYPNGKSKMYNITASENNNVKDFDRLYYSLPEGIHVNVKFEKLISQGLFVGCTNLTEIKVDPANTVFKSCEHGVLYDKNGYYVMRIPEGDRSKEGGENHFEIPSKVVKLYAGAIHGVSADIVLHSNPDIGVVKGHEDDVKNAKFYLSLDDIDGTITANEAGYGGARDFTSTNNNHYQGARYKRAPLAEDVYGTIVLPFVPTNAMDKYDFFKFAGSDETSFSFWHVDELEPNTPYLYKLKAEDERQAMTMKDGLDVFEGGEFTVQPHAKYDPNDEKAGLSRALGAYVNHYIETAGKKSAYYYYSLGQKKFLKVTNKLTYRPYRAIFVVTPEEGKGTPGSAPTQMSLRIRGRDGSTTEIEPAQVEGFMEPEYYDLMGRRVLNPTNGVYIVDGKKVVIR